ncbi:MAG: arginine biosynthesis protein ArgJ [Archaeoglobus sp.]|nr:MAG: arginine biosynthesis protein ArgJ [Archaeoglobus sp.]
MKLSYTSPKLITDVEGVECSGLKTEKGGLGIVKCRGKVAGVFTKNKFRAAPVIVTEENIANGFLEGIIVNSGNANAYTGKEGIKNAVKMAEMLAEKLECSPKDVAVSSTGIIGVQLDMEWIGEMVEKVYPKLGNYDQCSWEFAKSITTTDAFTKQWGLGVDDAVVAGVAKGAGMIAPNMATMLAYIFTDANVKRIDELLKKTVSKTFNSITVDGDTSTNDTVLLISTGSKEVNESKFERALRCVCSVLAEMIVADGEGATKLMRVFVRGAESDNDAYIAAKTVASSTLVKTALFGCDANWGRIIAALGYSGVNMDDRITIEVAGCEWRADEAFGLSKRLRKSTKILDKGRYVGNRENIMKIMKNDVVEFYIDLGVGNGKSCAVGCDLSYSYVELNSKYTT